MRLWLMTRKGMDLNLNELFTTQILIVALAVGVLLTLIRRGVEKLKPSLAASDSWKKIALPSLALALGVGGMFAMVDLTGASIANGVIAGFASSFVYRAGKALLKKLTNGNAESPFDSNHPELPK